jgi:hypothetical protein
MSKTMVRIVKRGEKHVVTVTTPRWRADNCSGVPEIRRTMPIDLRRIARCLIRAGVSYYDPRNPGLDHVMMHVSSGATEFVLRTAEDLGKAMAALTAAGWLDAGQTQ